jgi:hypothetical protein
LPFTKRRIRLKVKSVSAFVGRFEDDMIVGLRTPPNNVDFLARSKYTGTTEQFQRAYIMLDKAIYALAKMDSRGVESVKYEFVECEFQDMPEYVDPTSWMQMRLGQATMNLLPPQVWKINTPHAAVAKSFTAVPGIL